MEINKASFNFIDYKINYLKAQFTESIVEQDIKVELIPSGKFMAKESQFRLEFYFKSIVENASEPVLEVKTTSTFQFININEINEIPDFFYKNSLAIVFPYLRAAISTISLQCNAGILILPLYNLSNLERMLRDNTEAIK